MVDSLPPGDHGCDPNQAESDMRTCSNSAIEPRMWNIRPTGVKVSMPSVGVL